MYSAYIKLTQTDRTKEIVVIRKQVPRRCCASRDSNVHPHIVIRKRRNVGHTHLGVMSVMVPAVGVCRRGKVSVVSAARKRVPGIAAARAVHLELAKSIRLLQSNLVQGFVTVVCYVVVDMPDCSRRFPLVRETGQVLAIHIEKTFFRPAEDQMPELKRRLRSWRLPRQ